MEFTFSFDLLKTTHNLKQKESLQVAQHLKAFFARKKEHRSVLGKSSRTELMLAPLPLKTSKVFFRCKKYITNT